MSNLGNLAKILATGLMTAGGTNTVLNTAYVYGSTGIGPALKITPWSSSVTITDVYVLVKAIAGAPTTLVCEVRDGSGATPGTLLTNGQQTAANPGSAPKWVHFTFSPAVALTQLSKVFVCVSATGVDASNTYTLVRGVGVTPVSTNFINPTWTSNGFSTAGGEASLAAMVVKFSDGHVIGAPYTLASQAPLGNHARARGLKVTFPVKTEVIGWDNATGQASYTLQIYAGATAPGGTALYSLAVSANVPAFFPPIQLAAGTYRFVIVPPGAVSPNFNAIEDYASFADVQAAAMWGGNMIATEDNGSGGWADYSDKLFGSGGLILSDLVTTVSGGLLRHPGMTGGILG